jgi:hypothetical protein
MRNIDLPLPILRHLSSRDTLGIKLNGGRNDFTPSGQLPLDQVFSRQLDRFGYIDPTQGARVRDGTLDAYWRRDGAAGNFHDNQILVGLDSRVGRAPRFLPVRHIAPDKSALGHDGPVPDRPLGRAGLSRR